jgi:hypothetical protein
MSLNMPNLDETLILTDMARVGYTTVHSRIRMYPQSIATALRLTAGGVSDTYGSWTELIPINTITFNYLIAGVLFENWEGKDKFMIQLAKSATPSDDDYVGEFRVTTPIADDWITAVPIIVKSAKIPANSALYGRVKALSANGYWVDFSLGIAPMIDLQVAATVASAWPW